MNYKPPNGAGNPDIEFLKSKLKDFKPPVKLRWFILVPIIVLGIIPSFFTIEPEEVGVIVRLGKYNRTVEPGLQFKIPFGVETVNKVPVQRQLKEEFGFRTLRAGKRTTYSDKNYQGESLQLTGDLNAAEVEWIVQYRINDAYKFLFRVRAAQQTFRDMNEAIMREVIGDRTVNEVLTVGRAEIAATVSEKLQNLANQYEMGIEIDQVVLQDVNPPDEVKPAFNEVNEAQQEKEKLINQAKTEYNQEVPRARGQAQRIIEEAKGYALERVNRSQGETALFRAVYKEYAKAKTVTKDRIYLETMMEVMPKIKQKIITAPNNSGIVPYLNVNDLKKKKVNQ